MRVYRDKRGRFAAKRDVVFGPWDDRVKLFGGSVVATPVTAASFWDTMRRVAEAQNAAAIGMSRDVATKGPDTTTP